MVYRGIPSKACLQCRKRKLRVRSNLPHRIPRFTDCKQCDLQKESCGQCTRATIVCSGYRDTEQLRVRNETQMIKQKVLSRALGPVPRTLSTTIDDKARNVFFSHYVSGFSNTYDVLESLYQQSPLDRPLIASVDAVSLAFLSFQFDSTQASHVSREKYLSALPLLHKALRTSEGATSDSTLLSVLLLDLYEKMTNNNPRSIASWMSHINGALALVDLRKQPLLQDYTGLRLSARLSTNLLISCISANIPVPPALVKLRSDLEPFLNKNDPKWQISGLVVKYADLKGAIQDGCLHSFDMITRATSLDREFISLTKNMPSNWFYRTTYLAEASERVLEQHYDTYPNHLITQAWNVLRVMRVLLVDAIRAEVDSSGTKSLNGTCSYRNPSVLTGCIDDLAKAICASVPQFTKHEKTISRTKVYCTTQKLQCYTLLFPLYVAGLHASASTHIKPWIVNQLGFMFDNMGIRNARVVVNILERDERTCPWDVYAVLGSYAFAA